MCTRTKAQHCSKCHFSSVWLCQQSSWSRNSSDVCPSVRGIDYLWTYYMDCFQSLNVGCLGPYARTFFNYKQYIFRFFYEMFSLTWDAMGAKVQNATPSTNRSRKLTLLNISSEWSPQNYVCDCCEWNLKTLNFNDFWLVSFTWDPIRLKMSKHCQNAVDVLNLSPELVLKGYGVEHYLKLIHVWWGTVWELDLNSNSFILQQWVFHTSQKIASCHTYCSCQAERQGPWTSCWCVSFVHQVYITFSILFTPLSLTPSYLLHIVLLYWPGDISSINTVFIYLLYYLMYSK